MCIIIAKPKGIELPKKEILKRCFENNPDGTGFMYIKNGKVRIEKGYFTFEQFYSDLIDLVNKDTPVVIHNRIKTHGDLSAENTHPFALTSDSKFMKNSRCSTDVGVAHNGIISLTSSYYYQETDSDTVKFVKEYLSLIVTDSKYYEDKRTVLLIEKLIGKTNKLALLSKDGHIELINDFIKDNGVYYSNSSYKSKELPTCKYKEFDVDWEFYKLNNGKYDFDERFCPMTQDGDMDYCDKCAYKQKCLFYKATGGK